MPRFNNNLKAWLLLTAFLAIPTVNADHRSVQLEVDVAGDGSFFYFEGEPTASGVPPVGSPFITRGYIYPGGTLKNNPSGGVLADGSAEFPNLVIGTWYCRGWHTQDGDAASGVIVMTTQYFDLNVEKPGHRSIVTDGIELADFDVQYRRAITGGTGRYHDSSGQHLQTYVGINPSFGFNNVNVILIDD